MNLGSNSNRNKNFSVANQVSEADEGIKCLRSNPI